METTPKESLAKFICKLGSGRLFVVVAVISTFCIATLVFMFSATPTETKLAVFGTHSTLATSIGKDFFHRERGGNG